MIVFTTIPCLQEDVLSYLGISIAAKFNLNSMYQDAAQLNNLNIILNMIPFEIRQNIDDVKFDIEYHNLIMSYEPAFLEFMDIVATAILNPGMITQVIIQESDIRDIMVESIAKLIQQRYGINSFIVKDIDDLFYISEQEPDIPGLFRLDKDMDRWRSMRFADQMSGDIYDMG